ncbi:hypothetical protein [Kitasatospora sp. NPDC047058]|uniref:hypothetical protein n=1 Tax=Kitasatospora sp. NPDC047058 TaxID=3155620 RepID=UPI0033C4B3BC
MTSRARMEPSPRAGALRLHRPRTTTMLPAAADYVEATTAHCPYLAPSVRHGLAGWTAYRIDPSADLIDVEAAVFAAGMRAAELVRPLAARRRGRLVCENVVIDGAGRREIDWPHWVLKNLYAPIGLIIGKFWSGEADVSRRGTPLPVPPLTFLSVRPAVRPIDPRFLETTPVLAETVAVARDDGRDVLVPILGTPVTACAAEPHWPTIRAWAFGLSRKEKP